jgi:hypothetical protein
VGVIAVFALLALGLLAACQYQAPVPPPAAPAPRPATADTVAAVRAESPTALIGRVIAIYAPERMAAVGDVPAAQFKEGDRVVFLGNEGLLTGGVVMAIFKEKNVIHVKWDVAKSPGRDPIVGDLCWFEPHKPQ